VFRAARQSGDRGRSGRLFAPEHRAHHPRSPRCSPPARRAGTTPHDLAPNVSEDACATVRAQHRRVLGVVIAARSAGNLVSAWLSDELGRKKNFYLFSLLLDGHGARLYPGVPSANRAMLVLGFPWASSADLQRNGSLFQRAVPDAHPRLPGRAFSYNFALRGRACFHVIGFCRDHRPAGPCHWHLRRFRVAGPRSSPAVLASRDARSGAGRVA